MAEQSHVDDRIAVEAHHKAILLTEMRKTLVIVALDLLGTKSVRYSDPEKGMSYEDGFDCSGFISHVVKTAAAKHDVDLSIPRHANSQWREFGEPVSYRQRQAGDLVYFPSKKKANIWVIGHVAMVLDAHTYIHAPGKPDTLVSMGHLPKDPVDLEDVCEDDIYTHSPAGVKRISLPIGTGRWHVH